MLEHEAIAYLRNMNVPRETLSRLQRYAELLIAENNQQNLIAASTIETLWTRHIVDSAQIIEHAWDADRNWLDVGSGAGLPGLVLSILTEDRHVLIEPRRLRAEFLVRAVQKLELADRVSVRSQPVEGLPTEVFGVITARALRMLTATLTMTFRFAGPQTIWLLHKGKTAAAEVADARPHWQGKFELLPSVTDASAAVVRVSNLRRRPR